MQQTNSYPRDPLEHYDILEDDQCGCAICVGWRKAKIEAEKLARRKPPHLPTCHCDKCDPVHRAHYNFQAFNTRRDLWIEASYHASIHKYGDEYMKWLALDIVATRSRVAWWANQASRYPLAYWFERFEEAVKSGVTSVTGAVSAAFNFKENYQDSDNEGGGEVSISTLMIDQFGFGVKNYGLGGEVSDIMLVTI